MLIHKWLRNLALGGLIAVPLTLSGCGLFSKEANEKIDAPPADVEMHMMNETDTLNVVKPTTTKPQIKNGLTVFLKDSSGMLAPITLDVQVKKGEDAVKRALEMMVEDNKDKKLLPVGFQAVLPKGTVVKNITRDTENKIATVEFSQQFADYNVTDERKIVEAVTWAVTNDPSIQKVQLKLEGQTLNEMPVDGLPMDEPMTREMGINLEITDNGNVTYMNSMPVTVYFSAVSPDNVQYYVPVTRLIEPSADIAAASLEQLIVGPLNSDALEPVMTPETKVKQIERTKDGTTITVDLTDSMFEANQKTPAEMLQAVILTLTENTAAKKVQIKINGETNVVGDDNQNYGKPATRPTVVNGMKA
ncbi:GerMN domain-containing protein [Paenibacillus terrigena]|uniref:GerMN domain-containing protein n=1 Tax=Paenibacillus terrigena TaxID=369333 RepID=UPI0028D38A6B|nr:GerMN domain-containing protein [Paenibacillus terrigena]